MAIKKISLDEKSWVALMGVMSDYIFLANAIIEQNKEQNIKVEEEMIEDLEIGVAAAGQLIEQLMGEPITKELH